MDITSIGPVTKPTRDAVRGFRDDQELPNYESALREILQRADVEMDACEAEQKS